MKKKFGLLILFVLFLAGCYPGQETTQPTKAGRLDELPATWTLEATQTSLSSPSPGINSAATDSIQGTPTGTPSPTPAFIPLTPTEASYTIPTRTPPTFRDPPPLIAGEEIQITEVQMATKLNGWAVGYQGNENFPYILTTQDGGFSWQNRTPDIRIPIKEYGSLDQVFFYSKDENTAWVLYPETEELYFNGGQVVWRTTDGGKNWKASNPLPFPRDPYFILPGWFFFIDNQVGWVLVKTEFFQSHDWCFLFATRDGGSTWELVNGLGDSMIEALVNTGIGFANQTDGWVTKDEIGFGIGPFLEQTRDGGYTWERVLLPHPEGFNHQTVPPSCLTKHPVFTSSQTGHVLVQCFQYDQDNHRYFMDHPDTFLFTSSNWGQDWQIEKIPSRVDQLVFLDPQHGFAMGKDHYRTSNSGEDWEKIKSVTWDGQFSFINFTEGWAVATRDDQIALLHTDDGGSTYQEITPVVSEK